MSNRADGWDRAPAAKSRKGSAFADPFTIKTGEKPLSRRDVCLSPDSVRPG